MLFAKLCVAMLSFFFSNKLTGIIHLFNQQIIMESSPLECKLIASKDHFIIYT